MAIQNDQISAIEDTSLVVDAANGVLANDTAPNGPLTVAGGGHDLIRTAAGGQLAFDTDGSYIYVSAPGFSGTDSAQYTVLDSSDAVVGTGTLTIEVAATAHAPFVSVGSPVAERHVVTAGFDQMNNGIVTGPRSLTALSGGGYVVPVSYIDQADGTIVRFFTFDADHHQVGIFDTPTERIRGSQVTALTDGGYALAWETRPGGLDSQTIHVQVFDAVGTPVGAETTIDLPVDGDSLARLAPLPDGGFVVVHTLGPNQLQARTFSAAGVPEAQSFPIGTTDQARGPVVLPNGQILTLRAVDDEGIYLQRYDRQGNPIGSEIVAPNDDDLAIFNSNQVVTTLSDGRTALSWFSHLGDDPDDHPLVRWHLQLLDESYGLDGTPITRDFTYTTLFGAPQASVTPLANGGFVVRWRGIYDPDPVDTIQAFDADGNAVGSPITFDSTSAFGASRALVYALPAGGFAIGLQGGNPDHHNLRIYDNDGNKVGEVRMQDPGTDTNTPILVNLPNGETLVLFHAYNDALETSRITVQSADFGNAQIPLAETGITFDTTAAFPVAIGLPDPDGSEVVLSFDVLGVPDGWILTAPSASTERHGTVWTVSGVDVLDGGTIPLVLTPNAPVNAAATLTVVAHTIDLANGSQGQNLPVPLEVAFQTGPVTTGTTGDDGYAAPAGTAWLDGLTGTDTVTFGFDLTAATISFSGNQVVVDGPSGSHTVLTGFERFVFTDGIVDNADGNRLVDDLFYYSHNHDVWTAHADADLHYNTVGWKEGRDPNAFFGTHEYLAINADVKAAGVNPLGHYDTHGWIEGRIPSLAFGTREYLAANPDVAAAHVDPLLHFLAIGASEGRRPELPSDLVRGFDVVYYLVNNPDVAAAGVDPLWHFQHTGWTEGRNPNAFFDTAGYLATYTDVAAAHINPLDHYNAAGWTEGRDPSRAFDTAAYLAANPDVAAAHVNPLLHYLQFGHDEGRAAIADGLWAQA
jgi:hypothetical protein